MMQRANEKLGVAAIHQELNLCQMSFISIAFWGFKTLDIDFVSGLLLLRLNLNRNSLTFVP